MTSVEIVWGPERDPVHIRSVNVDKQNSCLALPFSLQRRDGRGVSTSPGVVN